MKVSMGNFRKSGKPRHILVHVDNWDAYNCDLTLALITVRLLKKFKLINVGYPQELNPKMWNDTLDKMIFSMQKIANQDVTSANIDEVREGLKLFGEYFLDLWY